MIRLPSYPDELIRPAVLIPRFAARITPEIPAAIHDILATLGTDGDVLPHFGLGIKLWARGHRVTLATPETYRSLADGLGLGFCPLVTSEEVGRMIADRPSSTRSGAGA